MDRQTKQPMYLALVTILFAVAAAFASCDSGTRVEYDYQASAHIEPDTAFTVTTNHVLTVELKIQTPGRVCWELDQVLHGRDSDKVARRVFTYVAASIKKRSDATCLLGLDTVLSKVTIPFDSAGRYEVRYPQVNAQGYLVDKIVYYTIP